MATFSKKLLGKEVGQASVYAQPHSMGARSSGEVSHSRADSVNMTVGNINRRDPVGAKTSGIKTRGNGAATKGVTARGPMA